MTGRPTNMVAIPDGTFALVFGGSDAWCFAWLNPDRVILGYTACRFVEVFG